MWQPNTFHYHPHPNPLWGNLDKQLKYILNVSNSSTMEPVSRMKMSGDDSSCSPRGQVWQVSAAKPWCQPARAHPGCAMGFMHLMAWRLHGQGDSLCSCATSTSPSSYRGSWHPKLCLAQEKLTTKLSTVQLHRAVLGLPMFSCAAPRIQKIILPTADPLQAILPMGQGEGWNSREPSPW